MSATIRRAGPEDAPALAEVGAVSLAEKLARFDERWSPRIVGELSGQEVKLAELGPGVADGECHVLLFEPASTLNTGDVRSERTVVLLERI